jgi:hypothetical protein
VGSKPTRDNGQVTNLPLQGSNTDAFKTHILPLIEQDVNQGKNFAQLRQIYSALILAGWFKSKFFDSFYKNYINQAKTKGITIDEKGAKDKIYALYVEAFKKGAYNYVKKEHANTSTSLSVPKFQKIIKRAYFSGGCAIAVGTPAAGPATSPSSSAVVAKGQVETGAAKQPVGNDEKDIYTVNPLDVLGDSLLNGKKVQVAVSAGIKGLEERKSLSYLGNDGAIYVWINNNLTPDEREQRIFYELCCLAFAQDPRNIEIAIAQIDKFPRGKMKISREDRSASGQVIRSGKYEVVNGWTEQRRQKFYLYKNYYLAKALEEIRRAAAVEKYKQRYGQEPQIEKEFSMLLYGRESQTVLNLLQVLKPHYDSSGAANGGSSSRGGLSPQENEEVRADIRKAAQAGRMFMLQRSLKGETFTMDTKHGSNPLPRNPDAKPVTGSSGEQYRAAMRVADIVSKIEHVVVKPAEAPSNPGAYFVNIESSPFALEKVLEEVNIVLVQTKLAKQGRAGFDHGAVYLMLPGGFDELAKMSDREIAEMIIEEVLEWDMRYSEFFVRHYVWNQGYAQRAHVVALAEIKRISPQLDQAFDASPGAAEQPDTPRGRKSDTQLAEVLRAYTPAPADIVTVEDDNGDAFQVRIFDDAMMPGYYAVALDRGDIDAASSQGDTPVVAVSRSYYQQHCADKGAFLGLVGNALYYGTVKPPALSDPDAIVKMVDPQAILGDAPLKAFNKVQVTVSKPIIGLEGRKSISYPEGDARALYIWVNSGLSADEQEQRIFYELCYYAAADDPRVFEDAIVQARRAVNSKANMLTIFERQLRKPNHTQREKWTGRRTRKWERYLEKYFRPAFDDVARRRVAYRFSSRYPSVPVPVKEADWLELIRTFDTRDIYGLLKVPISPKPSGAAKKPGRRTETVSEQLRAILLAKANMLREFTRDGNTFLVFKDGDLGDNDAIRLERKSGEHASTYTIAITEEMANDGNAALDALAAHEAQEDLKFVMLKAFRRPSTEISYWDESQMYRRAHQFGAAWEVLTWNYTHPGELLPRHIRALKDPKRAAELVEEWGDGSRGWLDRHKKVWEEERFDPRDIATLEAYARLFNKTAVGGEDFRVMNTKATGSFNTMELKGTNLNDLGDLNVQITAIVPFVP